MSMLRAELLRSKDFKIHPIWEFVNDDMMGETMVKNVEKFPVTSLDSKLVSGEFTLANGQKVNGYAGNVNKDSSEQNQHFLAFSFFRGKSVFHLARYFDDDYQRNGPDALADFLRLAIEDVFPIKYDFTRFCIGTSEALKGVYPADTKAKLSLVELAMLAVPTLPIIT